MVKSQALATLHDIQLPAAVSWWPMAPGWYVVMVLLLFVIIAIMCCLQRHVLHSRAKQEALGLLTRYQEAYLRSADSQYTSMKVSELLRRVACAYFPREAVAGLQAEAWLAFLNKTAKGIDFAVAYDGLLKAPYQRGNAIDLKPLFLCAEKWIKQRRKPCFP